MVYKLSIANKTIPVNAKAVGFEVAEVESGSFGVRDPGEIDVVEETKEMVDQLNGPIKQSYKDYFNGIRAASQ
ncbi:hypothetical protein BFJ63_vAg14938 [Fusarium oxysporum f. sp. narcissi]|uniref:Uncharacterized protein n=3 Tax=Fusarium oxysporum TaxID=5507 RepID=A0A8H4YJT4_FUSOX|nr:hypothetical protein FOXYS1_15931 [Fusarium oxysporum]RKK28333.1 hypothetical protein BFJ65_g277 [Fusarium oxysporum f. sp. cepae]RKK39737.1 hypothetical protein BFJ66_g11858 [Fusarium oxysporum f. sp. cepae]RYC82186.1 hypothetical protein BFJ63_vAg14938 [Fusarium oxysporum f. sp. narcissi]